MTILNGAEVTKLLKNNIEEANKMVEEYMIYLLMKRIVHIICSSHLESEE